MTKTLKQLGGKYEGRVNYTTNPIPEGQIEVVNISTDGGKNLSVNFNLDLMALAEERHLKIMLAALEDAFYRLRPDLRRQ